MKGKQNRKREKLYCFPVNTFRGAVKSFGFEPYMR
jgi:hypothetical protein